MFGASFVTRSPVPALGEFLVLEALPFKVEFMGPLPDSYTTAVVLIALLRFSACEGFLE